MGGFLRIDAGAGSHRFSLHCPRAEEKAEAMDHFQLVDGEMHCEGVPLAEIAAAVGTPVYVYSTATMVRHVEVLRAALAPLPDPLIAYAVKANPNAAVLATLARAGAGADIVSIGEYARARGAGIPTGKI